jgi:raffinose/stachyose/melibiose transport system permease protein
MQIDTPYSTIKRWKLPRFSEKHLTVVLFLAPSALLLGMYVIYPIVDALRLSFFRWNGLTADATLVGLANWRRLLTDMVFWQALRNNLVVVALSIVIQIPIGLALAVVLERGRHLSFLRIFKTIYFFPMLMSAVAIGILFKYIFDPTFGLVNQLLALVNIPPQGWLGDPRLALLTVIMVISWQFIPFYMMLFIAALSNIPPELRDAARIDGATHSQYYLYIAVPLISGTIRTAIILALIGSLKYFDLIWVMTEGGPNHASELMATYMYKKAFPSFEVGYGSTIAVALFVVVMVISLVALQLTRRYETDV